MLRTTYIKQRGIPIGVSYCPTYYLWWLSWGEYVDMFRHGRPTGPMTRDQGPRTYTSRAKVPGPQPYWHWAQTPVTYGRIGRVGRAIFYHYCLISNICLLFIIHTNNILVWVGNPNHCLWHAGGRRRVFAEN